MDLTEKYNLLTINEKIPLETDDKYLELLFDEYISRLKDVNVAEKYIKIWLEERIKAWGFAFRFSSRNAVSKFYDKRNSLTVK